MRIVIIGRFGIEAFGRHIAETLRAMGHDVVTCDPFTDVPLGWFDVRLRTPLIHKVRGLIVKEMLSRDRYAVNLVRRMHMMLEGNDCDLILSTHDFLSPVALSRLRTEFSARIALWFPDHAARLERAFMLCGLYDCLFFKDPYLVERFRSELGLIQTHYLPECCNPVLHSLSEVPSADQPHDLGTAGNLHPARAVLLQRLLQEGHKLTVWGPPVPTWMRGFSQGIESLPFVANEDKVRAFRSCKIVLNTTHPAEVEGTNVRTFEAAAANAFQLVNYRSALHQLFDVETELATFRTADELAEKVTYYLPREEERRRMAELAQQRVLREHTYEQRLNTMLSIVNTETVPFNSANGGPRDTYRKIA